MVVEWDNNAISLDITNQPWYDMLICWFLGRLGIYPQSMALFIHWETKVLNRQIVGILFSNKPKWRYT